MEQILQGIPMIQCLLDDIVVTGKSLDDHCTNLDKVLARLAEYGLTRNRKKCAFFKDSLQFCGNRLDKEGIHNKIETVTRAPSPQNVSQLRSFLGLINYYNRFLPNLSTQLAPLSSLKKGAEMVLVSSLSTILRSGKGTGVIRSDAGLQPETPYQTLL